MDDQLTRRDMMAAAAAAGSIGIATGALTQRSDAATPSYGGSLRERADRKGLLFGSAVNTPNLVADPRLRDALRRECNILVPENELKWGRLQPAVGPLQFGPAEQIYAFAQSAGMKMRGHNLTWSEGEPAWAAALIPTLSPRQAGDMLADYVTRVVGHWRGRLVQWDVANEPITAQGELPEKLWTSKLGDTYIDIAFKAAKAADPNVLLMVNQTLIEQTWFYEERQRAQMLHLVERLLKRGVPIEGFGIESHLRTEYGFSERDWRIFLDQLTDLGLKIMITEFDINDAGTLGDIPARDAAAVALATSYLDTTLSYRNCLGILTWGITNRYTWLRGVPKKQRKDGAPLRPDVLDDDFQPTPLWQAVAGALDRAPHR